jgi:pSer/pThr/pTyr-binding forkhead associated (FHA) protein
MTHSDGSTPQIPSGSLSLPMRLPGGLAVRAVHRATEEVLSLSSGHPYAILGRASQAGIRLDDPSVSQCHAYLQLVDGVPYCIDLGSRTGVLWDDGGQGRGWIHPGQMVQIGMFDVQITGTGIVPLTTSGGVEPHEPGFNPDGSLAATLDVHAPTGQSGRFPLDLPVTLIGRHPACNLRFMDETVAYFQCAVVKTQGGVWCVDIMSRTGTTLNGRGVRLAYLRDGDLLEIGRISMLLSIGGPKMSALAAFGPAEIRTTPDSVSTVIAPLREMMEQFQQCFAMMARMFTTMQQEHTAMMCEQMRQIQAILQETRSAPLPFATPIPDAPLPPTAPATPTAKVPIPKPISPQEASLLADAHTWFLDRLHQNGTTATNKPKPN